MGSVPPVGYFGGNSGDMSSMPGYASPNSASQAWAGYQWPGTDPSKAADPSVSAAWAAYYQQYYGQTAAATAAAQPAAGAAAASQPSVNPQTGQADYSQAWIEYYRSLGMHEQAEAIMKQIQQNQTNGSSNGSASTTDTQQPAPTSASQTQQNGSSASGAGDPYASQNAAAWQQYSQYNYANYYKQESGSRNG